MIKFYQESQLCALVTGGKYDKSVPKIEHLKSRAEKTLTTLLQSPCKKDAQQ